MTEAVLLMGIQATGKSTFYKRRFADTHVRINLDMLRTRHRERRLVETCLEVGQRFVVDNTNPARADRARYIGPAREAGFRIVGYYFGSRVPDALARNAERPEPQRIPAKGVRGTAARLERPARDEGFDALYHVRIGEAGAFVVEDWRDPR